MLPFLFDDISFRGEHPTVLAFGAHSDDIEIGCGGTLLQLAERYPGLEVVWVVLSATDEREDEARASAAAFAGSAASLRVIVEDFRDMYFVHDGEPMRRLFEDLKSELDPDLILTHRRADTHQDHRFVCELTWNTFRNNLILEYEVPKYDGDLSSPNLFIPITRDAAQRKIDTILRCFATQRGRHWFTEDMFMAMLRLRGMEANSPTDLAEAFTCRKVVLEMSRAAAHVNGDRPHLRRSLRPIPGERIGGSVVRLPGAQPGEATGEGFAG